jgi:DNA polymerase (family 10)
MAARNEEIAALFREMADLLEIGDANPFRVRSYRNAAFTVEELGRPVAELIAGGADLTELRGIGEDLAQALREIVATGSFAALDGLRGTSPATLRELMQIPGLGPKRVQTLHEELGVETLDDLEAALESGAAEELPGFGEKTVQNIRETLLAGRRKKQRRLWADVEREALALEAFVRSIEGVEQGRVGGSFRRQRETVADLDAVASSTTPVPVIERFVEYPDIASIVSQGETRATVLLRSGLPVDLRVVEPASYGAALMYFTGARDHQIALRDMALVRGWKLNEYGLFEGEERLAGASEEGVYRTYGLDFIEPELREMRGEIEAARAGTLPTLVTIDDIRGDLHVYSRASGGHNSIGELAAAARERGYGYLAITDRVRASSDRDAHSTANLSEQREEIARLNEQFDGFSLLAGAEVEILEDGSLGVPDDTLAGLDLVVCAVHEHFDLSRAKQTARLLRAIEHPRCNLLAHPSGRLINEREPLDIDIERILETAAEVGCAIELNGDPHRLDLPARYCQMARENGTPIAITSHSASVDALGNMRYGIGQARRGWLEARDVVNARPRSELLAALRR